MGKKIGICILAALLVAGLSIGTTLITNNATNSNEAVTAGTTISRDSNVTNGKNAYEIAVEKGYKGTEEEWIASLVGETGENGKSAYEIAVENGYSGDVKSWLTSLIGANGTNGTNG